MDDGGLEGAAPMERGEGSMGDPLAQATELLSSLPALIDRDLQPARRRTVTLLAQLRRRVEDLSALPQQTLPHSGVGAALKAASRFLFSRWPLLMLARRRHLLADTLALYGRPGAVDEAWYRQRYPDVVASRTPPTAHFVLHGAAEGRQPNTWFDTAWYLRRYPDVAASGQNPLLHYLRSGRQESRAPSAALGQVQADVERLARTLEESQDWLVQLLRARVARTTEALRSGETDAAMWPRPAPDAGFGDDGGSLRTVLFVHNGADPMTYHYRIYNYADALTAQGVTCDIRHIAEVKPDGAALADILVLCRLPLDGEVLRLIDAFKTVGRPVVFDVDDLVFDPDRVGLIRHASAPGLHDRMLDQLRRNRDTLLACDLVTASTFALARQAEKLGQRAFVVPNTISALNLSLASASRGGGRPRQGARLRVGYFSGTGTHEADFAVVTDALHRFMAESPDTELVLVGQLDAAKAFAALGDRLVRLPLMPHGEMLEVLATVDINLAPLELDNAFTNAKSELKIFEAALFGVPTIASPTSAYAGVISQDVDGLLAATPDDWLTALRRLAGDGDLRTRLGDAARERIAPRFAVDAAVQEMLAVYGAATGGALRQTVDLYGLQDRTMPRLSVVATLVESPEVVEAFLEALRRQSYPESYEVVLLDDGTCGGGASHAADWWAARAHLPDTNPNMAVRPIRDDGMPGGRRQGLASTAGEVVFVIPADCMVNRDFLLAHAAAHLHGDCDAAFGPTNIEGEGRSPMSVLGLHEADPRLALREATLRDPASPDSFINLDRGNISLRRGVLETLEAGLIDRLLGPASGDSDRWADIELGFVLYGQRARLKFLPDTVSIRLDRSRRSAGRNERAVLLRDFRHLTDSYPDLPLVARPWALRTYEAPSEADDRFGSRLGASAERERPAAVLGGGLNTPAIIDRSRKLKVLTFRWHVPHQYELYKLGHEFTLATGAGAALCESWEWSQRPMPPNARMMRVDRIDPKDFDLAIVHFDENVLRPNLCLGRTPPDWGDTLRHALNHWNLPTAAVCHGTPQFKGQYDGGYAADDLGEVLEDSRRDIVELMRNVTVVCNSHQAQREWGFHDSTVIWHGFTPSDYPAGSGERQVLSMLRSALTNRPHYNGLELHDRIAALLAGEVRIDAVHTPDPDPSYRAGSAAWAVARYQNYVREIGRYSIYLNTTLRSPMPRSRGEAMMAGLASVSLRNHDVDMFIRNGENGFYADTAEEMTDQIRFLATNEIARRKMGVASRHTALDRFNQDRYLAEWSALIRRLTA